MEQDLSAEQIRVIARVESAIETISKLALLLAEPGDLSASFVEVDQALSEVPWPEPERFRAVDRVDSAKRYLVFGEVGAAAHELDALKLQLANMGKNVRKPAREE